MKKREAARTMIKETSGPQKQLWNTKYRKLRNIVTSKIRKEIIDSKNNRIDSAKDENEVWKVAKEIINPVKEACILYWGVLCHLVMSPGHAVTLRNITHLCFHHFSFIKVYT